MATEHDQKIAELTKRAERAEKIASLTDAQRAYHARLSPTESETFLAKSASDRDAVAKAAIVYTAKDGTLHFDVREAQLAKRIDDQDATIAKRDAELADERLAKRADAEIPHLGDADVRKSLLRAIDGIADEKVRSAALKALKGGSEAMSRLFKATDHRLRDGFELPENGNGAGPDDPALALRKRVEKYQTDHKIASYEQALIKATATDPEARRLYELARN